MSKHKFLNDILTILLGTTTAQVIGVLATPIVTRIYATEIIGTLGVFTSILGIILPVFTLKLDDVIVLTRNDKEANEVFSSNLYIICIFTILISLLLLFFNDSIISIFNLESVENYLFLLPVLLFIKASEGISMQWLLRKELFREKANLMITESFLSNLFKILFGILLASTLSLIGSVILGSSAFLIFFYYLLRKNDSMMKFEKFSFSKIVKVIKSNYRFPVFRMPENMLYSLSESVPVLMLTSFFGLSFAGFYSLGIKFLKLPTRLIGKSVEDVFYTRFSKEYNKNSNVAPLLLKTTLAMALMGIIPFIILFLAGPYGFSLVFGEEWYRAGVYARWMSIWIFSNFISRPSVRALSTFRLQHIMLIFIIVKVTMSFCVLYLGFVLFESDVVGIQLFSILGFVLYMSLTIFTIIISRKIQR